ncbi:MAG: hypothetical protein KIS94_11140 [Chitinophagales bacterium]|nr:hypothetical protein [Chitinophagales bacterium]
MKGRPPSRNKGLRDGYYLEVFNKGASSGIKIRKETEAEMLEAVEEYRRENKNVQVLGLHKKGEWMNEVLAHAAQKQKAKEAKAALKLQALLAKKAEAAAAKKAEPVSKPEPKPVAKPVKPVAKSEKKAVKKPAKKAEPVKKKAPAAKKKAKPVTKKKGKK